MLEILGLKIQICHRLIYSSADSYLLCYHEITLLYFCDLLSALCKILSGDLTQLSKSSLLGGS